MDGKLLSVKVLEITPIPITAGLKLEPNFVIFGSLIAGKERNALCFKDSEKFVNLSLKQRICPKNSLKKN